jgi:hypothetical protein
MGERDISGSPQSDSPTSKTPGAAPGDPLRLDMAQPIPTPDSPHRYALQLLILSIKKKPNQANLPPQSE